MNRRREEITYEDDLDVYINNHSTFNRDIANCDTTNERFSDYCSASVENNINKYREYQENIRREEEKRREEINEIR